MPVVLSIHVFSVAHLHDPYRKLFVLNGIDNSIPTLTNAVSLLACQFFMPLRSRVYGKCLYAAKDLLEILLWYRAEVFLNGFFEIDLIFDHLSSVS